MIPFVDLKLQYHNIKEEVDKAIAGVLTNADFILGEEVSQFEKEFAAYVGAKYAVGLDSGISSLELGMRALDLNNKDIEILTPANSFIASSSAISFAWPAPDLVECDTSTYNIDLKDAEKKITKKTKAIMPVHLFGQMVDMNEIKKFAKKYKLLIVEDACQAHGANYKGRSAGTFGDFAAFSFYPGKNLGTYGDAGIVTTNSKKLYEKLTMMRNYGMKEKYNHIFLAWNKRIDTVQAAILRVKLQQLDKWNKQRIHHAKLYTELLADTDIITPNFTDNNSHIFHLYVVRTKKRDQLKDYLHSKGIGVGIHYPIPIHLQVAYKHLGYKKGDFPVTEKYAKEVLSLPMFPEMTDEQIKSVVKEIKNWEKSSKE